MNIILALSVGLLVGVWVGMSGDVNVFALGRHLIGLVVGICIGKAILYTRALKERRARQWESKYGSVKSHR